MSSRKRKESQEERPQISAAAETEGKADAKSIWDFADEFLVECAKCQGRAKVLAHGSAAGPRLSCTSCGTSKDWGAQYKCYVFGSRPSVPLEKGVVVLGTPMDPYFHLPLWLVIPCVGQTLWAYNQAHLGFLRSFVESELRERPDVSSQAGGYRNRLLESRLPQWMKSAKNRAQVLIAIGKLQARLDSKRAAD